MRDAAPEHDPLGKVRIALPRGARGTAEFSPCGRYRHLLTREWGRAGEPIRLVFIGMNPSTAEAGVDDPTMVRVRGFAQRLGFSSYAMVNVMDYRATKPEDLKRASPPCSEANLPAILQTCARARVVVAAWGALPDYF